MRLHQAPVFIVMVLMMVFVSVTPVSAYTAPAITGSVVISGGTATYRIQRFGWSVVYEVTVKDTKSDGNCPYARLQLLTTGSLLSKDARTSNVCGNNTSRKFTGRIIAGSGTGLSSVKVNICIDRNLSKDPCSTTTKTIPQHTKGSLTSAQFTRLSATYNTSLSNFIRISSQRPAPFDWTHNGCSTPVYLGINMGGSYRTKFHQACIRHDFGYRNYGKRFYLHTDSMRQYIDLKFYNDMLSLCGSSSTCKVAAKTFYTAVRLKGGISFAGQG